MTLLERFIKYAKVHTTSDPDNDGVQPSAKRELELAVILKKEMEDTGFTDVTLTETGYLYGFIPATKGCEKAPTVGFIAHMDTAPDFSGEGVEPKIFENYDTSDIILDGITLSKRDFPDLEGARGKTLITTDGKTLLGADDKAGIAEILTMAERLIASGRPHGRIAVGFTPDEEIGRGADGFDVALFGADFAYTVDGGLPGEVTYENFNAAGAVFEIKGVSVHPGSAKDTMVNAALVAMEINSMLPVLDTPAHTEAREGFYHLCEMEGTVSSARLEYIVRDHSDEVFEYRLSALSSIRDEINRKYGEGTVALTLREQYRNMLSQIKKAPLCVDIAVKATNKVGLEVRREPIRGGTDGARLSFMGLPTPNLGTGGCAFHGPYEHITLEDMEICVDIILQIVNEVCAL